MYILELHIYLECVIEIERDFDVLQPLKLDAI